MTYDWQTNSTFGEGVAMSSLPPATIEETGWDILLALHSNREPEVNLRKLTSMVSAPEAAMTRWLPTLERRELISGSQRPGTGEIFAALTARGREMLDRYFSATAQLQFGAAH